jgi:hypothetical protein
MKQQQQQQQQQCADNGARLVNSNLKRASILSWIFIH